MTIRDDCTIVPPSSVTRRGSGPRALRIVSIWQELQNKYLFSQAESPAPQSNHSLGELGFPYAQGKVGAADCSLHHTY